MSTNQTREIGDVHVQVAVVDRGMPRPNPYAARREDGKGGRIQAAANNVTMVAINVSLSGAEQSGSVQKAKADFHGLFNQAKGGSTFDQSDRGRLNGLIGKHREGLTSEADRNAFDRVVGAFNDSWGGKKFASEDWSRFNAKLANMHDATAPVAAAPAPVQPAPAAAAGLSHDYFDKYYLGTSFPGASLYANDNKRADEVRNDLNGMQA